MAWWVAVFWCVDGVWMVCGWIVWGFWWVAVSLVGDGSFSANVWNGWRWGTVGDGRGGVPCIKSPLFIPPPMTVSSDVVPAGIYTPVTTFYKEDDQYLDLDSQITHAKFLYNRKIQGLLVCGSMGEAAHLTRKERHDVVAAVRNAIQDPDFKIIAGAPSMANVCEIVEESQSAKDAGADFFIVLVPGFFGPNLTSQAGIVDYFTRVADNSALPVLIYNYPGTSNMVTITAQTYKILAAHPKIVGAKFTHCNIDEYTLVAQDPKIKSHNFRLFTGLGQVLLPALTVGFYGAIDGLSAVFPKSLVHLQTLYNRGEFEEAARLQLVINRAEKLVGELNINGVKYALNELYGFGTGLTARPPLNQYFTVEAYNKFHGDLQALKEVEDSLA